jgi:hypothetical protein
MSSVEIESRVERTGTSFGNEFSQVPVKKMRSKA